MHRSAHAVRRFSVVLLCAVLCACGESPPPAEERADVTAPVAQTRAERAPQSAAPPPPVSAQSQFWSRLSALCGNAYVGYLTIGTEESDRRFGEADLKMHVRHCTDDEIRIPFHVGEDRSRTFVVRRQDSALTLHHRHLDESGEIAEPNGYGGATESEGTASRQEFVVDEATKSKLPESRNNVWAIEVAPGKLFAYELQRPAEERYFRVEFELAESIEPPPPPWGEG